MMRLDITFHPRCVNCRSHKQTLTGIHTLITVLHAASIFRYADKIDIRLVNLGSIVFFSNYILTTSSGRYLEDISPAKIVSVMYKLIISAKDTDDLYIGFDRYRSRRQRELTNSKNIKGKHHVRIILKDFFGFADYQRKATYGLRYKLTVTRKTDNAVLNKDNTINNTKN